MAVNIILENYVRSTEYECTERQLSSMNRESRLLQLFQNIMDKAM